MVLDKYTKCIIGALAAGLGQVDLANADGVITMNEWVHVASATVAVLGLVWGVTNTTKPSPQTP